MPKHLPRVAALVLATSFAASPAAAQGSVGFAISGRGDFAFPVSNDLSDAKTGTGFGVEGLAQLTPVIGIYAAYGKFTFDVDENDPGMDGQYGDAGFTGGLRFTIPLGASAPVTPWVRFGALYDVFSLEVSGGTADVTVESDRTFGVEVGAGLDLALGESGLRIQPAVRYRGYSGDIVLGGESVSVGVGYAAVGIGFAYQFGGR